MKNSKSAQMLRQADRTSPLPGTILTTPVEFFHVVASIDLDREMPFCHMDCWWQSAL